MSVGLTKQIEKRALPSTWSSGTTFPTVERIVEELTGPWAVSAGAARVLVRIVVKERRMRILEFGAGMSSRILAAALEEIGGGILTSVEENPAWCEKEWTFVKRSRNVDAALIPAQVYLKADRRGIYYAYAQTRDIECRGPYDLVFVDAPWGGYGRDGGLHAAMESVLPGGLIVLDDARRSPEQSTVRRWLLNYPDLVLVANDHSVGRGLSILQRKTKPDRKASVVRSVAEVWGSGLYELVRLSVARRRYRLKEVEMYHAL